MKLLVAGPESSGTRMLTALLRKTGAEVTHSSPAFREQGYNPFLYDAAVLLVRNGAWNARSIVGRGRFRSDFYEVPERQIVHDIANVVYAFMYTQIPLYIVTYESLVYETEESIKALCKNLNLPAPVDYDEIKNGNEKFWKEDAWEGDDRDLRDR